jgi:hypothetical protein
MDICICRKRQFTCTKRNVFEPNTTTVFRSKNGICRTMVFRSPGPARNSPRKRSRKPGKGSQFVATINSSMSQSALKIGNALDVVMHICSFIHKDYQQLLIPTAKQNELQEPLSVLILFRANLFRHFQAVLLSGKHNENATYYAAKDGNLDALVWVKLQGLNWSYKTCGAAANGGYFELLKWARANGCPWNSDTTYIAAQRGHFEILQWARTNGCPWNSGVCAAAAGAGRIDILEYARANGCDWDATTTNVAAKYGQLAALQWLRANGCSWDAFTCQASAAGGHLEVLQWARANGCPWSARTSAAAAQDGQLDVLVWVIENGCPWDPTTTLNTSQLGAAAVVDWLRSKGLGFTESSAPSIWAIYPM